ncbi:MAG: diacylglycerol kinase [Candidatus Omnitrophica bacterium]|nr:diacylglycerol kinase [Candidatus Omnitrophota bacterium]MCG2705855.1 diacylglycerol kinase [Candidatus Omnitrophota bacterium]
MANPKIVDSFNHAIEGLIYVLKTQRNMRIHFLFSVLITLVAIYLNVSKVELLIVLLAIAFVLVVEIVNTAVEHAVDLTTNTINPVARVIKDISAAAVLISAIAAFVVFYIVFSYYLNIPFESAIFKIKQSPWHISFIAFIIVLSLVVAGKVFFHRGTPLRGGMPSGHAALAFAIWTAIAFSSTNNLVIVMAFILAFFVARSRITESIHTAWEVVAGALVGILATTIVFQLLK